MFISKGAPNMWLLGAIVASSAALNAPVKPLLDAGILAMVADKSQYGKSRLYGQVGIGLGSYLAGLLIGKDYQTLFLFHALISLPTALIMTQFHPSHLCPTSSEPPTKKKRRWFVPPFLPFLFPCKPAPLPEKQSLWMALMHTMKNAQVALFFFMIFLLGMNTGVIENFAYVRIGEVVSATSAATGGVQASGLAGHVVGLLRLASSIAGGPIFWLSGAFIKRYGIHTVLLVSLLSFAVRFVNYVVLSHPLQALPAEVLRGATFALLWSGATYYIYDFSPRHLTATMVSPLFQTAMMI